MRRVVAAALIAIAACHPAPPSDTVPPAGSLAVGSTTAWHTPVTYSGMLACADCPGIRLTVTLFPDGRYRLSRVYQERSGISYEVGRWTLVGDSNGVVLRPTEGEQPTRFRVITADTLQILGAGGAPLPAALPSALTRRPQVDSLAAAGARAGAIGRAAPLEGTTWRLAGLPGRPALAPGAPPTLTFDAATHRASGNGGCNLFGGPYNTSADSLRFGPLASTKRACASAERTAQEAALLGALARTTTFMITGDTLRLRAAGQGTAEFVTTEPAGEQP